ncbi:MAG: hypothetical protein A2156_13035 [Deltaproteobacteria bacterium RBG_16_48_10]|nr:MAG: hypothetical protein A2156_13035 [Deltaproteobacteria bacterium RBG_16_48_10]
MERPLFIELIHRTKSILGTIDKLAQLSRGKFSDREFGDFFYKAVTKDIEKHNLLLNTFSKYIESTTPILKRDTVNRLIEEVLKKHQVRLEEKKTKIFKKFEKDLPETMAPDEQLKFILDSLLQYAMALMPADGNIEVLTQSVLVPGEALKDQESFKKNGKYIEIIIAYTGYKTPMEQSGKGLGVPSPQEDVSSDLVYRLVDMIAKKNQGTIKYEVDERESKYKISLQLPVERRKAVFYQSTNQ